MEHYSSLSTSTTVKSGARSPTFISSKAVPDLHNKILAKIRLNKRRSRTRDNVTSDQIPHETVSSSSPCDYEIDRDSPVPNQDLETYLASMFYMVDTYR